MTARMIGPIRCVGVLHELARMIAESVSGRECGRDWPAEVRQPHAPLDQRGDPIGLLERHIERRLADHRAVVGEQHGTRREHFAVAIGKRHRPAALVERCNRRERGAEIDADDHVTEERINASLSAAP